MQTTRNTSTSLVTLPATPVSSKNRRFWLGASLISATGSVLGLAHLVHQQEEAEEALLRSEREAAAARLAAEEAEEARRLIEQERLLRAQLRDEAENGLNMAEAEDVHARQQVLEEMEREVVRQHHYAASLIPAIAADYGSMKYVLWCILLMARDKATGSTEMEQVLQQKLSGITQALLSMNTAGETSLAALGHAVNANSNQLASRLMQFVRQVQDEHGKELPGLAISLLPVHAVIQTRLIEAPITVAGALLEVRTTRYLLGLLAERLGQWVGRAAATIGANLALAAADGPLPVGEAIALLMDVGFAVWALWDVWHITDNFVASVTENLRSSLDAHRDRVIASVKERSNLIETQALEARRFAVVPLLATK